MVINRYIAHVRVVRHLIGQILMEHRVTRVDLVEVINVSEYLRLLHVVMIIFLTIKIVLLHHVVPLNACERHDCTDSRFYIFLELFLAFRR